MNWRKPVIYSLLFLSGSNIPKNFKEMRTISTFSDENCKVFQEEKLKKILRHSWLFVPYYRDLLEQSGVIRNGDVFLENFHNIPILTKDIIRDKFDKLQSQDPGKKGRSPFLNTSGGSTGMPVSFIQDKYYSNWNIANKIFYKTFAHQKIGDRELRIWGSERDLMVGKEKLSIRLRNWLYNRKELNAFKMSLENMAKFVEIWNSYKPTWVEGYMHPVYEFARYVKSNNIKMHIPNGIITSAGTLYPEFKRMIQEAFHCPVLNRYGTREVGDVACSCPHDRGLHLSIWNHYIEVLDRDLQHVSFGGSGKIHITTLNNLSMPLIRYDIGDLATLPKKNYEHCSCGLSLPLLKQVEGREMSVFRTRDGKIVSGEFFIHFVGVVFNEGYLEKFQVIQEDYDLIVVKAIVKEKRKFEQFQGKIDSSIKKVMGKNCNVRFEIVDEISSLPSGKYLYTISNLK